MNTRQKKSARCCKWRRARFVQGCFEPESSWLRRFPRHPIRDQPYKPPAREEWARIVPELLALGVLAKIDRGALSAYCTCHAMALAAEAVITEKGLVVEEPVYNRQGDVIGHKQKRNPAIQAMTQFLQLKRSYLIEFGLTPASRSRLKIEKPAEPDPLDDYLARRGIYAPVVEN